MNYPSCGNGNLVKIKHNEDGEEFEELRKK